ncbi:hypothetical protein AK51_34095 [Serratia nematodiphila DZ0503SBS1]|nr:hypothetical protein AK51_34095 [Serratia nematodiphila DZ0503SBS1]
MNLVTSFQAFRRQDVTAFAVFVQNQRDVRGTVRIVLQTLNHSRDTVFVALEVNQTIMLLVATTDMTGGDTAIVVTTTAFAQFFQQRGIRFTLVQLRVNHFNNVATTRRCRFTFNNCHCSYSSDLLCAADEVQILAFFQGDVSFFQSLRRPTR